MTFRTGKLSLMISAVALMACVAGGCFAFSWGKKEQPDAPKALTAAEIAAYLSIQPDDIVVGSPAAPVTMVEYASLTCSHCADFTAETMPAVKKEWIATGKVKYVYRDLAWDDMALGMAKVVRCAAPTQRLTMVEAFLASQKEIFTSPNPIDGVKKVAMLAGIDGARVNACIKDEPSHKLLLSQKEIAMQKLGVKGTPALFINGTRIEGFAPYKDLKKTLEAEYAKATARAR